MPETKGLKPVNMVVLGACVAMFATPIPAYADQATSALGPDEKSVKKADELFEKGHHALDNRDLKGAESLYRKAIELNPSESRYHRQLCLLMLTESRGHEAEREALYATKADPSDWKSFLVLGRVYHFMNRIDEEVNTYKKTLAILPKDEKDIREKIQDFIKKDEEQVKKEQERIKKKKEWEEREYKNAY